MEKYGYANRKQMSLTPLVRMATRVCGSDEGMGVIRTAVEGSRLHEAIQVKSRRWRDGGCVLCEGKHGVQAQHWGMAK